MGLQGASLSPPHGETGAASRASWELLRCLGHVWGAAQQAAPTALGRWGDTEKTALKRHKALPESGTQTSPATARRWKGSHKTLETEMNVMRGLYPNREGLKEQSMYLTEDLSYVCVSLLLRCSVLWANTIVHCYIACGERPYFSMGEAAEPYPCTLGKLTQAVPIRRSRLASCTFPP